MQVKQDRLDNGMWWDRALYAVHGCRPRSEECVNCWAAMLAHQRQANPNQAVARRHKGITTDGHFNGTIHLDPAVLEKPTICRKSFTWAVWDDLFFGDQEDEVWCLERQVPFKPVPDTYLSQVFSAMKNTPGQTYVVLTKRAKRMCAWARDHEPLLASHIIGGVTAGTQRTADLRIPYLQDTKFGVKMISAEPLLGPINLGNPDCPVCKGAGSFTFHKAGAPKPEVFPCECDNLWQGIDWIVIGCESRHNGKMGRFGAFKTKQSWLEGAIRLATQAQALGIKVFVKQIPGPRESWITHELRYFPEALRLRELPEVQHQIMPIQASMWGA